MARVEKMAKETTQEEKLAQALVPDVEQPYQIPKNWCWCYIGFLSTLLRGVSYQKKDAHSVKQSKDCLILRGGNIGEGYIDIDGDNIYVGMGLVEKKQLIQAHDIIIVASTGSPQVIGRAGVSSADYADVAFGAFLMLVRPNSVANPRFMDYYFQSDLYRKRIRNLASGININNIRSDHIIETPYPLPPLPEQNRIVDRIENLFAKLDEAKEKAQAVLDGYEDRKTAILHKAFTGELTERWRQENGCSLSTWKKVIIQDVCEKITCGKTPKEFISKTGEIPYLKVYNIIDNKVDFESNPQFIPTSIHYGQLSSSVLKPNDVIMNIVGPPLRKIAIVPNTYNEWNMNQAIVRFRPQKELLDYRFLYYALINPETLDDIIKATKGVVGQANISVSQSRSLEISLPLLKEQKEIVKILEKILSQEDKAKSNAEQVINRINNIKISILKRAFCGELGTNDPNDENAIELLKRVLREEKTDDCISKPIRKRVIIPKDIDDQLSTLMEREIIKLFYKRETKSISIDEIMSLSSKKFELLDTIRTLEQKNLIQKDNNNCYKFLKYR